MIELYDDISGIEEMTYIFAIIAAALASVVAYLWARSHYGAINARQTAESDARAAAAEALVIEYKNQSAQKDALSTRLRSELDSERQTATETRTRLEEAQKALNDQKVLIEGLKVEMTDTFNALSGAALKSNNEEFLRIASLSLKPIIEETKGKLKEHKSDIDGVIKPLSETLKRYEEELRKVENDRHKAQGSLIEQISQLNLSNEKLKKETGNLVTALRKPHVRGRWGEMQLRRVAELSGMSQYCDFKEQHSVASDDGVLRPDMVVFLPSGRQIVVDSKVPLDAFIDAVNAATEDERKVRLERHAAQLKAHIQKLSSKKYSEQFEKSPEFVVLFLPGESFFSTALDVDSSIMEEGIQKKVIVATPTTFIALLHAVAYGWRQEELSKNAQQISVLGKEMYDRFRTFNSHITDLGGSISKVNENYNRAVGTFEARIMPSLRKFRELGVATGDEINAPEQVDKTPRPLNSDVK